jgi:Family of unknown function (DUF695)
MPSSNNRNDSKLPHLTADGDWAMLEGENDGTPMLVRRNDTVKGYVGHQELPFRMGLAVPFLRPDENGFPATDVVGDLDAIEDALVDYLEQHQVGALVLVITTDGMREFVSYMRSMATADSAVEAAAAGGEDHEVQYYVEEDPAWDLFSQFT